MIHDWEDDREATYLPSPGEIIRNTRTGQTGMFIAWHPYKYVDVILPTGAFTDYWRVWEIAPLRGEGMTYTPHYCSDCGFPMTEDDTGWCCEYCGAFEEYEEEDNERPNDSCYSESV